MQPCNKCKLRPLLTQAIHLVQSYGENAIANDLRKLFEEKLQQGCRKVAIHEP